VLLDLHARATRYFELTWMPGREWDAARAKMDVYERAQAVGFVGMPLERWLHRVGQQVAASL
jgi:hypothetical protein